ncbi:MAG: hypothetical protein JNL67_11825 [Planctomycetaceae bacterium]|nr:hypothetical protein [Planctomycetaceae bacterium]
MNPSPTAAPLGFLTCTEFDGWGLCGGLLLLNQMARPLEFHCTLPVKVSRTQIILYGSSMRAHICGQVIGKALLEKAKSRPGLVITDCPETATMREESDLPLALIAASGQQSTTETTNSGEVLNIGRFQVYLTLPSEQDREPLRQRLRRELASFAEKFDLDEPFERVRQAMTEARDAALRAA